MLYFNQISLSFLYLFLRLISTINTTTKNDIFGYPPEFSGTENWKLTFNDGDVVDIFFSTSVGNPAIELVCCSAELCQSQSQPARTFVQVTDTLNIQFFSVQRMPSVDLQDDTPAISHSRMGQCRIAKSGLINPQEAMSRGSRADTSISPRLLHLASRPYARRIKISLSDQALIPVLVPLILLKPMDQRFLATRLVPLILLKPKERQLLGRTRGANPRATF